MYSLSGATILVTGGTGSFGRRFVETVLQTTDPKKIIVFSRDELKQHEMRSALPEDHYPTLRFFIGDVRDADRLGEALRGVDHIVHAAALKQVPTAEYNPFEAIKTNVLGAQNVIRAAIARGVRQVVALSTDKAANPINLYGATKLCADKLFVAANAMSGEGGPAFSVVRYGNVFGSRGSVVPFFLSRRASGVLPITDPGMTRFSITLRQSVDFVLRCLKDMRGGEVFVPKMPSYRLLDLAHAIAPEANGETVGIRPGEKLHEVMVPEDDARTTVEIDDRYIILPAFTDGPRAVWTKAGAVPVDPEFRYASDSNDEWLTAGDLAGMVEVV